MLVSFLNDVDIKLILAFINNIEKYHPVYPKNPFFGHPVYNNLYMKLHFTYTKQFYNRTIRAQNNL